MLKQRSLSAVGIVVVTAVPAFVGGPFFSAVVLVLGLLALREILQAIRVGGTQPFVVIAYLALLVIVGAEAFGLSFAWVAGLTVAAVLLMLAAGITRADVSRVLTDWALTLAVVLYIALPLAHFIALRGLPGPATRAWVNQVARTLGSGQTAKGLAWFGLGLTVPWLTDTAAYLVGRSFGKTKLIPAISPGKTRVGSLAGIVAGTATGVAAAAIFGVPIPWYVAAGVGFALSIVGQVGDLAESLIKRSLGIKDMGTLIPGHGGILDRIDALLFALPAAYYLARLIQEVRWP